MRKFISYCFVFCLTLFIVYKGFVSCKNYNDTSDGKETIIKGKATILVDESLQSIIESQIMVFESQYPAKITQINNSETEIVNDLIARKQAIAVLSRTLTEQESAVFKNKKITPRITQIATDAVVFVTNISSNDTLVDVQDVFDLLQNKQSKIKSLTFENANSSTQTFLNTLAGISKSESKKIFSVNGFNEVLNFIRKNPNSIGVVGLNNIVEPTIETSKQMANLKVMSVRSVKNMNTANAYYKPSQDNLGAGLYPFARNVYVLNFQGTKGLGMGFASFMAGEIGQRIVLKSGLLPVRMPSRIINTRKGILK